MGFVELAVFIQGWLNNKQNKMSDTEKSRVLRFIKWAEADIAYHNTYCDSRCDGFSESIYHDKLLEMVPDAYDDACTYLRRFDVK